jgi:integrase
MPASLTEASIKRLPVPERGSKRTYDAGYPKGFGVCVTAGGARSFILRYRVRATGRERCITIGAFPNWQVAAARARAKELKQLIDLGGDPLADIEAQREAPSVADLIKRFEEEHLPRLRKSSQEDYRRMLRVHVRPHFGTHMKVAAVSFEDVDRLHRKITKAGHHHRANRVIAVLSKMFGLAVRWQLRETNPARGVERNIEHHRQRYLLNDELVRLTAALAEYADQQSADIIRLLLLTGARRGEVLSMRWADVDLTAGKWSKPPSSTKQKKQHEVPLSAPARQLLAKILATQTGKRGAAPAFVFPGIGGSGHVTNIKRPWRAVTKAAGIRGLRIHDLRHSYASQLVSGGASLPLIGALLGHSNPTTTARYSHLFDDPLRQATERVGAIIVTAGVPAPAPTKLKAKRRKGGA